MKKREWVWLTVLLCGMALLLALDVCMRVVTYEVASDKVDAPVRLAVLTDLRSCAYGEGQKTLLDAVAAQSPDVVLLGGDIVDDVLPEENAWSTVWALAEIYPCAYVTGNHEWWSGEAQRICEQMAELEVKVLRGDGVTWYLKGVSGQKITVFGIDDPDSGEEQLAAVGNTVDEDAFTVLLAHRSENIERYLEYPFDLIISGHAHGGQWRIPGFLTVRNW